MGSPPKRFPMNKDEMLDMENERNGTQIYKVESDKHKKEEISKLVSIASAQLQQDAKREKLELTRASLEDVQAQITAYFEACEKAGTIPSFENLCHAFGYSAKGVYNFISSHPGTANAELLQMARETMANTLDNAALMGYTQPAVSIFIMKALYERREVVELIAAQKENPLGEPRPASERAEYIKQIGDGMPDIDD